MSASRRLTHQFVEFLPDEIEDGVVYISIPYATASHRCCCGCGNEVVTPITPTDWSLIFDGDTISLTPSIGNWSFNCKSHYWITKSRVVNARRWSDDEIAAGRSLDATSKGNYFGAEAKKVEASRISARAESDAPPGRWTRLRRWFKF